MGAFNLVSANGYLQYTPETGNLSELSRQPQSRFTATCAELLESAQSSVVFGVDPTRGQILATYLDRPSLRERVAQGGLVGYVIIGLGVIGILLSLYALHATADLPVLEPFKAFKEFPDSAPYVGAFASHTEQILVPAVEQIKTRTDIVAERLGGRPAPASVSGDFAFVVRPLPKIYLCYIFYEADEDFPPSVTCLYSANANRFMPMDGLADVGEYTSKTILDML